jgi:hypothetical protein
MSIRRGYSDSKLTQILKPKFDDENLGNFLPNFLLKDIKEDSKQPKQKLKNEEDVEIFESEKYRMIFDSNEEEDLNDYLQHLSIKEVS